MARMNVSIPDAMREAIQKIGDRVNWSAVAQEAFDRQLRLLALPTEANMQATIERLRASKEQYDANEEDVGVGEGKDWVTNCSDYGDLKKLASIPEAAIEAGFSLRELLRMFEEEGYESDYFFGDDRDISDARVTGFVRGVQEIWEEISDQL